MECTIVPGSSNGRTPLFGSGYLGSNPSPGVEHMSLNKIIIALMGAVVMGALGYSFFTREKISEPKMQAANPPEVNVPSLAILDPTLAVKVKNEPTTKLIDTNKKIMNATLHTNHGDITIALMRDPAPNTVANFIKLAESGFYDGTKFHRVIKGFMNQGGDPLTKDDAMMARWGTGGPGYTFADEIAEGNSNDAGTIAMANAGHDTNGSQFFINVSPNHFLDAKHTVFGRVTAGLDVVMAINAVPTGAADRPIEPVIISSVTLK